MTEIKKAAIEHSKRYSSATYKYDRCTVIPSYTARNSFEAGAQWKSEQSPWISVKERLPEKDDTRVFVNSSYLGYRILLYNKGKFYESLLYSAYDGSVTHWMPIPE